LPDARKRRRRGGRGRRREDGEGTTSPTSTNDKPRARGREQGADKRVTPSPPTVAPAAPPETHKKPGFFRRLGNLFKRS
jgi:ATP-dependent RNA helicase RhlB